MLKLALFLCFTLLARAEVVVQVSGIKNVKGDIRLVVFAGPDGFPDDPGKAFAKYSFPAKTAKGGMVKFRMPDFKAGKYAFVALHDEDSDKKLKRGLLGIPKEGVAISNYKKVRPPKFKKATVVNPKGVLRLKLGY